MSEFDFDLVVRHLVRLVGALVLALPIAWDRGRQGRTLGVRTLPLVAASSAAWALLGHSLFPDEAAEARILQGLVTGVGFLGGGAIVKRGADVQGLATAASIWSMAAVGAAAAYDRWEIAVALAAITLLTLRLLTPIRDRLEEDGDDD